MATKVWIGNISSVGSDANNWAGGVLPTAGDDILADSRAQRALTTGSDFSADLLGDIKFTSGYRFGLGAVATPFICKCAEFVWQGSGDAYINVGGGGAIVRTIIDAQSGFTRLTDTSGQMNRIEWIRGQGEINNSTNIDALFVGGGMVDAIVTLNNANGLDLLVQSGGLVLVNSAGAFDSGDSYIIGGGEARFVLDDGSSGATLGTFHQAGGFVTFAHTTGGYALTNYYLTAGVLAAEPGQEHKTIGTLYQSPGAEIQNEDSIIVSTAHIKIGLP